MDKLTQDLLAQAYEDEANKEDLIMLKHLFKQNSDYINNYSFDLAAKLAEINDITKLRRVAAGICLNIIFKIGNIMEPVLPALSEMLKSLEFAYTKSEKSPVEVEMEVGKLLKSLVIFLELDDPDKLAEAFKKIAKEHKDKWN